MLHKSLFDTQHRLHQLEWRNRKAAPGILIPQTPPAVVAQALDEQICLSSIAKPLTQIVRSSLCAPLRSRRVRATSYE